MSDPLDAAWKHWRGVLAFVALVLALVSIGIGVGPDGNKWWIPLLLGFVLIAPVAALAALYAKFGNCEIGTTDD